MLWQDGDGKNVAEFPIQSGAGNTPQIIEPDPSDEGDLFMHLLQLAGDVDSTTSIGDFEQRTASLLGLQRLYFR